MSIVTQGYGPTDGGVIVVPKVCTEIIGIIDSETYLRGNQNRIRMFIGDTRTLSLLVNSETYESKIYGQIKKYTRIPVDLNGAAIWFTVKYKTSDPDSAALISKASPLAGGSDSEIKILTPTADGKAEIYLLPEDSENIDPGLYVYGVQLRLITGDLYTIIRDRISFKRDVLHGP